MTVILWCMCVFDALFVVVLVDNAKNWAQLLII